MYTHSTEAGWISRSHTAIAPFGLERPASVADAVGLLAAGDAVAIAGGIDLCRRLRAGDRHDTLVDLSRIAELSEIDGDGEWIRIGAMATHWDIETSSFLDERLPRFQAAWKTIGNIRVRMAGTIGGNVMAGERGYDGRVLLGTIGARLVFAGAAGEIAVPAAGDPAAYPAEGLLSAIDIPAGADAGLSFDRSLKPIVSVAVARHGDVLRVGIGCAAPAPVYWSGPATGLGEIEAAVADVLDNPFGSAAYRRRMIGVLVRRLAGVPSAG